MFVSYTIKRLSLALTAVMLILLLAGCGSGQQAQGPNTAPVVVKAMQVVEQDTVLTHEFVGQIQPKHEVEIKARVSGNITAKYVAGGSMVKTGQALFEIDARPYQSAVLAAKGQLAQSQAALNNAKLETIRYQQLADQQAIARQVLDTALSTEQQNAAVVAVNQAKLQQAEDDLRDTVIIAPVDGRMDLNELAVGNFVQAGQSVLATISTVDPVHVQFSIDENLYLQLIQAHTNEKSLNGWGKELQLLLSDGNTYPLTGSVEEVDRGLTKNTGALTVKALFKNPDGLLLPGMFARVVAQGETKAKAILIPQRAVQELLGKTFVTIVTADNKAETRAVTMGTRIGRMWLVESGLNSGDRVVVEGISKLQPGAALQVNMIEPGDLEKAAERR